MPSSSILPVTAFLLVVYLGGCAPDEVPIPSTYVHPETVEQTIDEIFAPWDSVDQPGVAVVVTRADETIYRRGFGASDPESGTAIDPKDTVFNIASVTKQFTAFAILLLAEDGLVDLDADVREYLSWFPDFGVEITLRHLLHHTSGLREYSLLSGLRGEKFLDEDPYTQSDGIEVLASQRELNFPPGSAVNYCNSNYLVLAEVIAAVSGRSYQDFLADEIFAPLGMDSTKVLDAEGAALAERFVGVEACTGMLTWGESGVLTTADDMAVWARHLLAPTYRPAATRRLFERGRLSDRTELRYAAGLEYRTIGGVETVGHGGSLAYLGFVADLILVPSRDLGLVVLGNDKDAVARGVDVVDALLPDAPTTEPDPKHVAPGDYDAWVGRYMASFDSFDLLVEDGELIYRGGRNEGPIDPTVDGRFQLPFKSAASAGFLEGERIERIEVRRGLETIVYRRVTPADPRRLDLGEYAGTYRSPELGVDLTFEVQAGGLLEVGGDANRRYDPVAGDCFRTSFFGLLLCFERDERGVVDELRLEMQRVRGLRYERVP